MFLDSTKIILKTEYGIMDIPSSDIVSVQFPSFYEFLDSVYSSAIEDVAESLKSFNNEIESTNLDVSRDTLNPLAKSIDAKEPVRFVPYDDPPRPRSAIRPKYPQYAKEKGIEGTVIVQVFVNKKGRVTETTILNGFPNSGLDEAAIKAIRKTRFRPAKQRGESVGVWISIPINFRLK